MRKALTAALAAITLGGAVCATAAPAEARPHGGGYYGGYYGGYRHHDNTGAAVAAGVVGLALGAALASNHGYHDHGYYDHGYYDRGYYDRGYGYYGPAYAYSYGPGYYGTCETTRWVWDPYIGRRVAVRSFYPC